MEARNGKVTRLNVGDSSDRKPKFNDSRETIFMSYEEMAAGWEAIMKKFGKKHE